MSLQCKKTGCTREAIHEENGCAGVRTANSRRRVAENNNQQCITPENVKGIEESWHNRSGSKN